MLPWLRKARLESYPTQAPIEKPVMFRRRRLPHWDVPGATYFVTSCLAGSIPAEGLLELERYRTYLAKQVRPADMTPDDWETRQWKLGFARLDVLLDAATDVRWLADPAVAAQVASSLRHFAGERYDLSAFVIMPNHYHWLFRPREEWVASLVPTDPPRSPRERISYSIQRYSANQCNRLLGRQGQFWQHESYDHWVRDLDELERIIHYIENNPVRAGLCRTAAEWPHSSAALRVQLGLPFAAALPSKVG
jgi:putative transposase